MSIYLIMKKRYFLFLIISLLTIVGSGILFINASHAEDVVNDSQNQAFVEGAGFAVNGETGRPKDPREIISSGIKVALSLLGILFTTTLFMVVI